MIEFALCVTSLSSPFDKALQQLAAETPASVLIYSMCYRAFRGWLGTVVIVSAGVPVQAPFGGLKGCLCSNAGCFATLFFARLWDCDLQIPWGGFCRTTQQLAVWPRKVNAGMQNTTNGDALQILRTLLSLVNMSLLQNRSLTRDLLANSAQNRVIIMWMICFLLASSVSANFNLFSQASQWRK